MAQQKSEDRVLLEGGVMPAERAGSSHGGQGKAVPVDQTAWQLRLPIATADDPQGATRRAASDRSEVREDGTTWQRMSRLEARWLPPPRILHPWPDNRFIAKTQGKSPVR